MSRKSKKGRFIAIEGIDGAGTTTQAAAVARWLRTKALDVLKTMEPSRWPMGKHIRDMLKGPSDGAISPTLLALAFAADRLEHLEREIYPALDAGKWVVTDRYILSSLAYQSMECDPQWVRAINRFAPQPELTLLIDVSPETALERIRGRGGRTERFDSMGNLKKIRDNYLKLAHSLKKSSVAVIDGTLAKREVTAQIKRAVSRLLP